MSNAIREHSGKKKTFWGTFGTLERSQSGAQAQRHGEVRVHPFKIYGNKASEQLIKQTSHFCENENWLLCPQALVTVINVCELLCLYDSVRPAIQTAVTQSQGADSEINVISLYIYTDEPSIVLFANISHWKQRGGVLSTAQLINISLPWLRSVFVITSTEATVQIWVAHYIGTPFQTSTLSLPWRMSSPTLSIFLIWERNIKAVAFLKVLRSVGLDS